MPLWKAFHKGKTHLAIALGVEACRKGKIVRFFRVSDLVGYARDYLLLWDNKKAPTSLADAQKLFYHHSIFSG
ncbi:ATP-binding protein [Desulfotomaculum nigrificans]|uniref:ATP-binding protein n=1 Tax=Desulfotomaculum nigrificans TaxID=1565 RepID=UPI000BA9EF22|nr:ATP-binding protein [Desulfotomaculum nigrificans]